ESRFTSDPAVTAVNAARPKNRSAVFTIAFSTAPKSLRSFRAEISCPREQLWQVRRVISHDHFRRNNTDKAGRGLSLFLTRPCPDPNSGAQRERLYEISGGL